METKQCKTCKEALPILSFTIDNSKPDGHCLHCRICYQNKNRERDAATKRKHYRQNKDKFRDNNVRKNYGITLEEYLKIKEAQAGVCYICGCKNLSSYYFCLDHNHTNGKLRKFLCRKCNMAVGIIEDTVYLNKLLSYLMEHE